VFTTIYGFHTLSQRVNLYRPQRYDHGVMPGRDDEIRRVDEVVAGARSGAAAVLLIQGEAGIGKTALIRHAAAAADGFDVHLVRAVESENALSFALISMIIGRLLSYAEVLPPVQQRAIGAALGQEDPGSGDAVLLGAAVLGLLTQAARTRPQLLLLDDVHWADEVSLRALMFALRRLDRDPVGAVLALRDVDVPAVTRADFAVLHPSRLAPDSVATLVAELTGRRPASTVAERITLATGGNPLAVAELARALDETVLAGYAELPDPLPIAAGLVEAYARTVLSLPDAARRVLLVAACSDERAGPVGDAARQLGLNVTDLEPAEDARLVTISGGRVAFVHPLVRTAILANAAPADRRAAHRALAGAEHAHLETRAWHLALATHGVDAEVARLLEAAAESAGNRGSPAAAANMLGRAADLAPQGGYRTVTLIRAAEAARRAGRPDQVRAFVDSALRDPVDGPAYARLLALKSGADPDPISRHATALEAAALLVAHDPSAAVDALDAAMEAGLAARSAELVRVAAQRAIALDAAAEPRAAFQRDAVVGPALAMIGDLPAALPALAKVLTAIETDALLRADPSMCLRAMVAAGFFGKMRLISELAETSSAIARHQGLLSVLPKLISDSAEAAAHRGDWHRARALAAEAADLGRAMGDEDRCTATLAYLAEVLVHQGDDEAAASAANERLRWADARGINRDRPPAVRVLAILEMRAGQPELALRRLAAEASAPFDGRGVRNGPLTVIEDLVDAALLAGVPDAGHESTARLTAYARISPDPLASALAARCRAQLSDDAGAEEQYRAALAFHEQDANSFATARTRLCFGEWLRRRGRRAESRDLLNAALAAFDRLGARPWAARTAAELRATGQSLLRHADVTVRLTPQELRVGMAVADGITNQEAADRLFLSVKTVEYHLGGVFRKLGVTSRTQLARHPLFSPTA
jgi:DNA-binding CsgD family transcriptional regulator